jgi:hypothetical protein
VREVIFTHVEAFDLEKVKPEIEEIRDAFDNYLESYPVKTARSKHGLMGPAGKILQKVKGEKWDTSSLTGYALNIHMANPRSKFISDEARAFLEKGIDKLLCLLSKVPITAQDKVLERIDYGLYYERRKKGIMEREERRMKLVEFFQIKYNTPEKLAEAWGEKIDKIGENFEKIWIPSKKDFDKFKGQKKNDFIEFFKEIEQKGYNLEIEEEEE